jgi:hypothetical protein
MIEESELVETDCPYCGSVFLDANLQACFMCDRVQRACAECLKKHEASSHSQAEVESFWREIRTDHQLTLRERHTEELKQQLRAHTETLCKLIDDQEEQIKRYERQCRVLAEELDRRTPAS